MSFTTTYQTVRTSLGNDPGRFVFRTLDDVLATGNGEYSLIETFYQRDGRYSGTSVGAGIYGSIDLLTSGQIVTAATAGFISNVEGAYFAIGSTLHPIALQSTVDDVAALRGGGFVVLLSNQGGTQTLSFYNNSGTQTSSISLAGLEASAQSSQLTALTDGGFVLSGQWTAIYNADGSVRQAAVAIASPIAGISGQTFPSVLNLSSGGFAVAYGVTSGSDDYLVLNIYNAAGVLQSQKTMLDVDFASAASVDITEWIDGTIMIGYSDRETTITTPDGNQRQFYRIYDPVTDSFSERTGFDTTVWQRVGGPLQPSTAPQLATLDPGRIVYLQTVTNGGYSLVDGWIIEHQRYSVGDGANDTIFGNGLTDIMRGGDGNDQLTGAGGRDWLAGEGGNDTLNGGDGNDRLDGGIGTDTTSGGLGNDLYIVDSVDDVIIEAVGHGDDRVATRVTLTLAASASIEQLTTTSVAGTAAINLYGNGYNQTLQGNAGSNILDGKGGADTMQGMDGNDTYYVNSSTDVVTEASGSVGGSDRIYVMNTHIDPAFTLTPGSAVEEIIAWAPASWTIALVLTGNSLVQSIFGNAGENVLDGGGGADSLNGLGGNDIYRINDTLAIVSEAAGNGLDRVRSTVNYSVGTAAEVEILEVAGLAASTISLTGNNFTMEMYGHDGRNRFEAAGAEIMRGGKGDDTYVVNDAQDKAIEAVGGGTDLLATRVSYALGLSEEIEKFSAATPTSTMALNLTGNHFVQIIQGNSGNNMINSLGGNDTVSGMGGNDTFVFANTFGLGNMDTITDFDAATDSFRLSSGVFAGLTAGALDGSLFKNLNLGAQDADDRIIYNDSTGSILYDSNGLTAGGQIQFVLLVGSPTITYADFVVV